MRLSRKQTGFRALAFGKSVEPLRWVQSELRAQLFGISRVPFRIESLAVPQQLIHAHPAGQVRLFREITNASQNGNGISDWIKAEYADRSGFGAQQAENMFDQG